MLRDGKFIKEDPPKIGSYYIQYAKREYSEDEKAMQDVNLGCHSKIDYKEKDFIFWIVIIFYSALALLLIS